MIALKRLWGPNKLVREKMSTAHSGYSVLAAAIRESQHRYLVGPRSPQILKPIGIDAATADWIREKYKNAPKGLNLDWIKKSRDEHDLTACPMCGGTSVSTLEHVLPKADYPEFSVLSFNLVPCCDGCQKRRSKKGNAIEFIHPYFDHQILNTLRLTVEFDAPYDAVGFRVVSRNLTGIQRERVEKHLKESIPPRLFKRHMNYLWHLWHKRSQSPNFLRRLTDDLTDLEEFTLNSWDIAFLRGLLQSAKAQHWMSITPP